MRKPLATFILLALVVLPGCDAIRGPKFVARITIVNPFEYSFLVEVGDGRSGWLNLGGVNRNSEDSTLEVIDMGARWVFRSATTRKNKRKLRSAGLNSWRTDGASPFRRRS